MEEKKKMITVRLPYPISANRYWRLVRGRNMVSKEAEAYKMEAGLRARLAGMRSPLSGPISIKFVLLPKAKKNGQASLIRLDLSNCIKVSEDALNGIAFHDDNQVVQIVAEIGEPVPGGGLLISVGAA